MTEYQPETSICAVQLDSQGNISEEDSNDTTNSESNVTTLEDPTQLGINLSFKIHALVVTFFQISFLKRCIEIEKMQVSNLSTFLGIMNSLDGVTEFEENLMNELDSDFMNMVPNPQSQYIMQHMDIREPLTKLRKLIENRLGVGLQDYVFALQGVQIVCN